MKLIDLTGQKFNRLEVVKRAISNTTFNKPKWVCFCDCGKAIEVSGLNLRSGNTKSCGCLQVERAKEAQYKHRSSYSPEYSVWAGMIGRCCNPFNTNYSNYGGRGIKVCERWRHSFQNFLDDIGKRPSPLYSLERINNDGNYTLSNCKWATRQEQNINRRNVRWITIGNDTKILKHWLKELNVSASTFHKRLKKGWGEIESLTHTPTANKNAGWIK